MRLLLTLDFPPEKGGIQYYLYGLVVHTYHAGDRILTIIGDKNRDHSLKSKGIRKTIIPFAGINKKCALPLLAIGYVVFAAGHRDLIVECGNVYTGLIPLLFRPLFKRRFRVYTYGSELLRASQNDLWGAMLRLVLRRADEICVLGSFTASLLENAGIYRETITIPPRIETSSFHSENSLRKLSPDSIITMLSIGRLVPHKGHLVLLQALSRLPSKLQWRCCIAGSGPQEKSLRSAVTDLSLTGRVQIDVSCTDSRIKELYAASDIFILPSLTTTKGTEGFGIVLLEAMAAGIPVIASATGGIPEVLDNGKCGLLVPAGDPQAITDAVLRIVSDSVLRAALVVTAKQRVADRYAW
jgi:phosphatidyl-myo-inositol dimannoside synthase